MRSSAIEMSFPLFQFPHSFFVLGLHNWCLLGWLSGLQIHHHGNGMREIVVLAFETSARSQLEFGRAPGHRDSAFLFDREKDLVRLE
jgi:hypothetical protein